MGVHDADYKKVKKALGIPEDEPIFVLRAQDDLAVHTIVRYINTARQIEDKGMVPDSAWFDHLNEIVAAFAAWQSANPDRVKVPD